MNLEEKFLIYVEKTETCWIWKGTINNVGYGMFSFKSVSKPAHRWSYEIYKGIIPLGKQIDHLCTVKNCVNPKHLEVVSAQTNSFRARKRSFNGNKTHCINGHEYTFKNTAYKKGSRQCITCRRTQRVLKYMWRGK